MTEPKPPPLTEDEVLRRMLGTPQKPHKPLSSPPAVKPKKPVGKAREA